MRLSDYIQAPLRNGSVELFQIDAENLSPMHLEWLRDPHVGKFLEARFQEHSSETILQFVQECEVSRTVLLLGIKCSDSNKYIGNIKLNWNPNHGVGDIGIMIGDVPSWSKGLASSAIALMCRIGFGSVRLRKITAGAYASNFGSIKAFEKNGFKVEAILADHVLQNGHPDSVCMMGLFDFEFVERESAAIGADDVQESIFASWSRAIESSMLKSGLCALEFKAAMSEWEECWLALPYQPVFCQKKMIDYQHTYLRSAGWMIQDWSLVLLHDGRPAGLWPLTIGRHKGKTTLSSAGTALIPPFLLTDLPSKSIKTICTRALQFVEFLCRTLSAPVPVMQWPVFPDEPASGLSEWQQQLLRKGVLASSRYELFVKLEPPLSEIRNGFRKSYKSLINKGISIFLNQVIDATSINPGIWNEFRSLHFEVAGRSTRSDETWQIQYEMILNNCAFLVTVRDRGSDRLLGAGFFQYTRDEGLYSVAAYDRSMFDKPIGHAVQQIAIEKMKELGLKWYRIGERRYPQEMPPPTSKEVAIGEFKHGFSSHEFARQEYRWPVDFIKRAE